MFWGSGTCCDAPHEAIQFCGPAFVCAWILLETDKSAMRRTKDLYFLTALFEFIELVLVPK